MEDNKPNIFDKGLQEALDDPFKIGPVKISPELQDILSEWLNEIGETDPNFVFIHYFSVLWYLCTKDRACFDFTIEFLGENIDVDRIPRLTSSQTYEILSCLGEDNASFLLSKIECKDGVYTELIDSLKQKSKQRFVAAIGECDSSNINPTLKTISIIMDYLKLIEDVYDKVIDGELDESQFDNYVNYKVEKLIKNYAGLFDNEVSKKSFLVGVDYGKTSSGSGFYCLLYGLYHDMKNKDILDSEALGVFEYVLRRPPFLDDYLWCQNCFKYGTIEEGLKKCASRYPFIVNFLNDKFGLNIISYSAGGWQLPVDFFDDSYIDKCDIHEYFPLFLSDQMKKLKSGENKKPEFLLKLAECFKDFVDKLAEYGFFDNDNVTKSSFARALTGRKVDSDIKPVKLKRQTISSRKMDAVCNMCYLVNRLYPRQIPNISKYEHIFRVFSVEGYSGQNVMGSYANRAEDKFKKLVDGFLFKVEYVIKQVQQPSNSSFL